MRKPDIARRVFPPPALDGPTLQRGPAARWHAYWNARTLVLQLLRYPSEVLQGLADELERQNLPSLETLDRLCSAAEQQAESQE